MEPTSISKNTVVKRSPPSWIDYLIRLVNRVPGSKWVTYFGLGVVLLAAQGMVLWVEGALPIGKMHPAHLFLAGAIPFIAAMIHHLNEKAKEALETIKPALSTSEEEYLSFEYRLTTHPALPILLASVVVLGLNFFIEAIGSGPYQLEILAGYPVSSAALRVVYQICWWFFGAFIYHTYHKLKLINQIYSGYTKINLFRMKPLYAFSNVAALTAVSLIVLPYGFMLVNADVRLDDPVTLGVYVILSLIPAATFIWPQLGIHRLQNNEKERLLDEANQRYQQALIELHERIDQGNYAEMANLNSGITCLDREIKSIEKISTWPWKPETLRWLITALVLPLGLWIIQFFLQRLLLE